MLLQHLQALNAREVILASASPQRLNILKQLGLNCKVVVSGFQEDLSHDDFVGGGMYAETTAKHKTLEVAKISPSAALIIGADTVVECNGEILEKAADEAHAAAMLSKLSGQMHQVHTGVALVVHREGAEPVLSTFHETTHVVFDTLNAAEIARYVESGEAFGKAGAYGIQGPAGAWVSKIQGCYFNVVGFPLHRFAKVTADLIDNGTLAV